MCPYFTSKYYLLIFVFVQVNFYIFYNIVIFFTVFSVRAHTNHQTKGEGDVSAFPEMGSWSA